MPDLDPTTDQETTSAIKLIAPFQPQSLDRAWQSVPHPRLPLLASCASDKTVRIYSLTSFTQLSVIAGGHKRSVRSCAWKPNLKDESTLATGSFDASVGVWRREDEGNRETDFTNSAGVDDDEEEEDEEWRYALVLDGHDSEVKSVAWSAGGNFLATCSRDKSVWIWEEVGDDDYETIAVLQEHTADVKSVAWHPEEELLASGSYDDDIRLWKEDLDDWGCIGLLQGHKSTVWMVEWEGLDTLQRLAVDVGEDSQRQKWLERRKQAGPRLISCSDDISIRVWRRQPKQRTQQNTLSIIRTDNNMEEWIEEAQLPEAHDRAIYAVSWSKKTGRVVSSGSDGRIVVYEERWKGNDNATVEATTNGVQSQIQDETMADADSVDKDGEVTADTEWQIIAELDDAHGVFEVNHVVWARRADKDKSENVDEEVIVSTGDDGVVKVWSLKI